MTSLPLEVQEKILIDLNYEDIINYCNSSEDAAEVCEDASFWRDKGRLEGIPDELLNGITAKRYGELLDYGVCLWPSDTYRSNLTRCLRLAIDKDDTEFIGYIIDKFKGYNRVEFDLMSGGLKYSILKDKSETSFYLINSLKDVFPDVWNYEDSCFSTYQKKILADIYVISVLKNLNDVVREMKTVLNIDDLVYEMSLKYINESDYDGLSGLLDIVDIDDFKLKLLLNEAIDSTYTNNTDDAYSIMMYLLDKVGDDFVLSTAINYDMADILISRGYKDYIALLGALKLDEDDFIDFLQTYRDNFTVDDLNFVMIHNINDLSFKMLIELIKAGADNFEEAKANLVIDGLYANMNVAYLNAMIESRGSNYI